MKPIDLRPKTILQKLIRSALFILIGKYLIGIFDDESEHWKNIGIQQVNEGNEGGKMMIERAFTYAAVVRQLKRYFNQPDGT